MGKKNFTFLRKELSRFGINLCLYTHVEKFNRIDVKVFRRTEKHMYFCRFVDPLENRWQNFQKLRKCSNTKPKAREAVKILFSFFFLSRQRCSISLQNYTIGTIHDIPQSPGNYKIRVPRSNKQTEDEIKTMAERNAKVVEICQSNLILFFSLFFLREILEL